MTDSIYSEKIAIISDIMKTSRTQYSKNLQKNIEIKNFIETFPGKSFLEQLYNCYHNNTSIALCPTCNKENIFIKFSRGYQAFCCRTCEANYPSIKLKRLSILNSKEVKQKRKNTCIEKYGVENAAQTKQVQDKMKISCLAKYGVDNAMKATEIKDKSKATCLIKFGTEYALQNNQVIEKRKQTCIEKYGVDNVFAASEIKNKIQETNIEKYGFAYPMQNTEVFIKGQKTSFIKKLYTFTNGREVLVQGYEPMALAILENIYQTDDIIVGAEIPKIYYFHKNKHRTYYPDIFIKSINKIIEVKSEYTYKLHLQTNKAKREACIEQGFSFEFWILDNKSNLTKL